MWTEDLCMYFSKEDIQMANRYMKGYPISQLTNSSVMSDSLQLHGL